MSYVITLRGFVPPPRYDAVSWTLARIEEGPAPDGPWTVLETLALTPDPDPSAPARRNLTTSLATIADGGWYRVTFVDALADETSPTDPVRNSGATSSGRCGQWTSAEAVAACCTGATGDQLETAIEVATETLWILSGRRFAGECEATVRPMARYGQCFGAFANPSGNAGFYDSTGFGWGDRSDGWPAHAAGWSGLDGCRAYQRVKLAGYPVREITEVLLDGAVVDPSTYRLERGRFLARLEGTDGRNDGWPSCQYLDRADGEPGTWSVRYLYGEDPPVAGQSAATELACQIYRACGGADDCALPTNIQRVIRQGVDIQVNASKLFVAGRTGLPVVDTFLTAYEGQRRRSAVWSPDLPSYPLRTG